MSENDALECGRTLEDVSAALDAGTGYSDPHMSRCPYCQNALALLAAPGGFTRALLEADAESLPEPPASWLAGIMDSITRELRSGRSLPIAHPDPQVEVRIDEGAVKALLRSVGDSVDGVVIGSVALTGDVEEPGAPVGIAFTISVAWPRTIPAATAALREAVERAVRQHTELNVTSIDITVVDMHGFGPKGDQT